VELDVEDQIPISRDQKVVVRLANAEPKPASFDELTGVVEFRLVLPPASRRELVFTYEITVPKDLGITQEIAR